MPPGGVVIVPVNGTFGTRIVDILGVQGIRCVPVDFGFGQPIDLARVEAAMLECRGTGFAAVAMTHHETSSGLLNPVAAVGALARRHGLRTIVDATSSAGAEDLDLVRDWIDVCITSSGKCLHAAPGIAIVAVRRDLLAARAAFPPRSYALDLVRHHQQIEANSQTPFTPAVPLFVALDRAVSRTARAGRRRRAARPTSGGARCWRPGCAGSACRSCSHAEGIDACSILTVAVPDALGFDAFFRAMRERGYLVYGAKPPLAPRYFQVSVMGELSDADLAGFLAALESVLARRGRAASRGHGLTRRPGPAAGRAAMFDLAINRKVFADWRHCLAFGFGSGLARYAPGTFGTLASHPALSRSSPGCRRGCTRSR